jgi:hypothetical protein
MFGFGNRCEIFEKMAHVQKVSRLPAKRLLTKCLLTKRLFDKMSP